MHCLTGNHKDHLQEDQTVHQSHKYSIPILSSVAKVITGSKTEETLPSGVGDAMHSRIPSSIVNKKTRTVPPVLINQRQTVCFSKFQALLKTPKAQFYACLLSSKSHQVQWALLPGKTEPNHTSQTLKNENKVCK